MDERERPNDIVTRPATEADTEVLGCFGASLVSLHHAWDPRRFIGGTSDTPARYAGFLSSEMKDPSKIVILAERAGRILGYVYAAIEGPDYMALRGPAGVIHDLFVVEQARGSGIGGSLFDDAIKVLRERGSERIVLSTAHRNHPAQRLLASRGFRSTMVEMTLDVDDELLKAKLP